MFTPLICGSFQDQEDEDMDLLNSCVLAKKSSRKPARKHSFGSRTKESKNPYADRGLDKFAALVAELDSKRQQIYTQKGSEDITLLGFVYSDSADYKPIVVRLRNRKQDKTNVENDKTKPRAHDSQASDKVVGVEPLKPADNKLSRMESNVKAPEKVNSIRNMMKLENLRRPAYYVPVIVILILIFLAVFGRSFAILCTSLGWYFIPTINTRSSNLKKTKTMKKDYVKALSYNNKLSTSPVLPSSPKSVLTGGDKSPPQQGRRSF